MKGRTKASSGRPKDLKGLVRDALRTTSVGHGMHGRGYVIDRDGSSWFVKVPLEDDDPAEEMKDKRALASEVRIGEALRAAGFDRFIRPSWLVRDGAIVALVRPAGHVLEHAEISGELFIELERFLSDVEDAGWRVRDDIQLAQDDHGVFLTDLGAWKKASKPNAKSELLIRLREMAHWSFGTDEETLLTLPEMQGHERWLRKQIKAGTMPRVQPVRERTQWLPGIEERLEAGLSVPESFEKIVREIAASGGEDEDDDEDDVRDNPSSGRAAPSGDRCPIQIPADAYVIHGGAMVTEVYYGLRGAARVLVDERCAAMREAGYNAAVRLLTAAGVVALSVALDASLPPPPWPPLMPTSAVRTYRVAGAPVLLGARFANPRETIGGSGEAARKSNPIDPRSITNYSRTTAELEEFCLFAIIVAGKRADMQAAALARFLAPSDGLSPFEYVRRLASAGELKGAVESARLGQYGRVVGAFATVASSGLDLSTCGPEDLERVPGIGPKTSRFVILHSRRGVRCAALDTHILAWLREKGIEAPTSTPQASGTYGRLEREFLRLVDERGGDVAAIDLEIWKSRQVRAKTKDQAPAGQTKPRKPRKPKA